MPSALKQPYTQPDKTHRQHHQHQLSRQETKAQHSRTKQNKGKLSVFSAVSASHTPTTFTVFYSVVYLWCMYGSKKPVAHQNTTATDFYLICYYGLHHLRNSVTILPIISNCPEVGLCSLDRLISLKASARLRKIFACVSVSIVASTVFRFSIPAR